MSKGVKNGTYLSLISYYFYNKIQFIFYFTFLLIVFIILQMFHTFSFPFYIYVKNYLYIIFLKCGSNIFFKSLIIFASEYS